MRTTVLLTLFVFGGRPLWAEEAEPAKGPKPLTEEQRLSVRQEVVGQKFTQLEKVMLRMAEALRVADPDRSAVLLKAIARSKEDMIGLQLERLVELLQGGELGTASKNQKELKVDLNSLLTVLLSGERDKRLKDQIERLKEQLRTLNKLIADQKRVKGETELGIGNEKDLSRRQQKLANKSRRLVESMEGTEGEAEPGAESSAQSESSEGKQGKGSEGKGSEGKGSEGKGSEGKGSEGKGSEGKGSEGKGSEGKGSEGKGSEGKGSEGKGSEGKGSEGKGQDGSPQPGAKDVEDAAKEMEQAKKELDEKDRDDASKEQEEAVSKLEKARRELEEMLRQLREEERDSLLAALEARLQKMLAMQKIINESTQRIDKTPREKRSRQEELLCVDLSKKEVFLVRQANAALAVLRDEGTAVAFPEAMIAVREDMRTVADLLARADTGELTQSVEQDIVAALEEMIAALQKEQKSDPQQSGNMDQDGMPQPPPLLDILAELKMIRSLQMRVNRRTDRVARLVDGKVEADVPEPVKDIVRKLAEREGRIVQVTEDLATGRNQ